MVKLTVNSMYPSTVGMNEDRGPSAYLPKALQGTKTLLPGEVYTFTFIGKVRNINENEICIEFQEGEVGEKSADTEEAGE